MKTTSKLIALGLAGAIAIAAAVPASAGSNPSRGHDGNGIQIRVGVNDRDRDLRGPHKRLQFLNEREVRRILQRNGFHDIKRPQFQPRHNVYVAYAEKGRSRDVRVTVNARNGRIIDVDNLERGRARGEQGHNARYIGPGKR